MRKLRGFKISRRLITISKCFFRRIRKPFRYQKLKPTEPPQLACRHRPITKLINWGRRLTSGAKSLCFRKPSSGYIPLGHEPVSPRKHSTVPKGHLAVYVGQKDGDFHRVFVPVIYMNHPLFGQLLREAEEEYGFNQQGGITIPCRFSEFESVKTRIAAVSGSGRLTWKRNRI
ncbi:hypothetical protein K2173_024889 [Erythroxylum novogranatense]|uniref:Small auxin up regulated protein n=1 Tax=Erythroxylum novogranatense TaxID=1862640 RepID=A0AAV8UDX1_9ROSI|nr:hypothetical protein K2173_024889 [Erythroxylum novogranatense]